MRSLTQKRHINKDDCVCTSRLQLSNKAGIKVKARNFLHFHCYFISFLGVYFCTYSISIPCKVTKIPQSSRTWIEGAKKKKSWSEQMTVNECRSHFRVYRRNWSENNKSLRRIVLFRTCYPMSVVSPNTNGFLPLILLYIAISVVYCSKSDSFFYDCSYIRNSCVYLLLLYIIRINVEPYSFSTSRFQLVFFVIQIDDAAVTHTGSQGKIIRYFMTDRFSFLPLCQDKK